MKILTSMMLTLLALVLAGDTFGQKPSWVDDPGSFAVENFVAVGVAKDKKIEKAREKAEKKARNAVENLIKKKYPKKDVKSALAQLRIESYWKDPGTGYQYALALLPMEAIDKDYSARKKADKAKNSAMGAIQMLNATLKDPDVVVVQVDESEGETEESVEAVESEDRTTDAKNSTTGGREEKKAAVSHSVLIATDFKNKSLGSFNWIDQDGNSKYSFLGENLTVTVAAYESFKPEGGDKKAPRLEVSNIVGDFVIEAKFRLDWSKYYQVGAGLYALDGKQNVLSFVKFNGSYVYLVGHANGIELPRSEKSIEALQNYVFFKLERKGYTFTSYYSTVDGDWIEIGSVESEFPSSCGVGIVFMNEEESSAQTKCDYVKLRQ